MTTSLRIAVIASTRFPIGEPFAGGLEAHTWALVRGLRQRGHRVTVFAGPGSDPTLDVEVLPVSRMALSDEAADDVSMPARDWLADHHAYLTLMLQLAERTTAYDIVQNSSLHYLPLAMARTLLMPMVCTLHTPPTPWLESAIQTGDCPVTFCAVSAHTARAWRDRVPRLEVIANGVDPTVWKCGPGGGPLLWAGRIVPEKGPHLAMQAALRAGLPLELVGPIGNDAYFAHEVQPLLGPTVRYVGHVTHRELAQIAGRSSAALVTPCWDEPYGLVAAEALSCGTPVAGFARGALPDLLDASCSLLVAPGDVPALADALPRAQQLSRTAARDHAVRHCSQDVMLQRYEQLYRRLAA